MEVLLIGVVLGLALGVWLVLQTLFDK